MEWNVVLPNLRSKNPIINSINQYVLKNLSNEISLKDMSEVSGVSTFYLCRLFNKELNITPIKWLWTQRTMAAASYLKTNKSFSLTDVAFACGFTSSAHFSRLFKSTYGIKPSHFRKQHENSEIQQELLLDKNVELLGDMNNLKDVDSSIEIIPEHLRKVDENVMDNISLIDYCLY